MVSKKLLFAGASVLGLLPMLPSFVAADEQSRSGALEEVVVTARRREENLQVVPLSITAISQEELSTNNIRTVSDLQYLVPSMGLFAAQSRDEVRISIRAQGGSDPGSGPAVATYLNEVPLTGGTNGNANSAGGGPGRYYDLENVQVLKGPQGTLFGRNTTGGALLIRTKRPTDELGGYIEGALGNYNDRELTFALNVPVIGDKVLARVAANTQTRDGFTKSLGTPNHPTGIDLDNRDFFAGRVTLTFKPSDNFQNDVFYDAINTKTHGTSAILVFVKPGSIATTRYPGVLQTLRDQQALGIRAEVPVDTPLGTSYNYWSLTDIMRFDVSESLTFRNIFGYSKTRNSNNYDGDGTAFPVISRPAQTFAPNLTQQFTEEPQLQGKSFDNNLTWVIGGFFLSSPAQEPNDVNLVTFGAASRTQVRTAERSEAAYAQGTYDLSLMLEGLKFTGGFRYSWDYRYTQNRRVVTGACPTVGADAQCALTGRANFSAPTWTVGLDYQISPETMTYVASRRGYRTGGFNISAQTLANQSFGPEYVTDVEVGLKSDWNIGGTKARTNFALYHQDYKDIQLTQVLVENGSPLQATKNAGDARIWGAEFEGVVSPVEGLDLGANFAWIDYKDTGVAPGGVLPIRPSIPDFKYGLNIRYHLPVDEALGKISLSANWNWQDDTFIASVVDPFSIQGSYGLLTLGANWEGIAHLPVDASFFMTNATNKAYSIGGFPISASVGTSAVAYGEPRMFGFRLRYHFGAGA